MTIGSPLPDFQAVELRLGRHGPRWYVVEGEPWNVRGGPFETAADAELEIARRYAEIQEYVDFVEAESRRLGVTVQW